MHSYERPQVADYGTVLDVTEATGFSGPEDGGSKLLIHHSAPVSP